ncbi:crotonase/enoyl-CoA hydratase family protein [Antarcticirhabdus aurantiaca]|uniref:Crotonase/enoyl-CoA hydratase family protein n=1 Tax=Antarcticirhabdus aurantiaca TaxID=2606717 RepID=A0ACD4NP71_9HYPH|nr:crotonase/enoyl-CoA hydratase family protein [Antarcticirhabdus aurantiaca]WAJ28601.1 crotonase/enoyl-CoA hydratase family protein [Jeongeuplla avenae]
MSGFETIRVAVDEAGTARLTLARPAKHNALSAATIAELTRAAQDLGADDTVRAVVLSGEGRSFCAGADLAWMREQFDAPRAARLDQAMALARMLRSLNELPKPLIGRINGQAFGGGLGLIAVCDVALAADSARFAFTETALGLIPATISPFVLARMGEGAARRVFFSARAFDATEGVALGLFAKAVPGDGLDAAVAAELAPYRRTAPAAVARAKALARSGGPVIDDAVLARTAALLADAWEDGEARARIGRFLDRAAAKGSAEQG